MLKGTYYVLCHRTIHNVMSPDGPLEFLQIPICVDKSDINPDRPHQHGVIYMRYVSWATVGKQCL